MKIVAVNRKAKRDYEIEETCEAGIELKGSEVKSLREGNADINDAFARIVNGEVWLYNFRISPYRKSSVFVPDPDRPKKLLLKRREIDKLLGKLTVRGYTLIPLKVYFNERGWVKVELALVKGKKLYDKRAAIKEKELEREAQRISKYYK
ncbi:MAG: SsrA-binding protein SmpB [Thermosulfidibacteraceae bacterium]|jgi:SsrA-binding protein